MKLIAHKGHMRRQSSGSRLGKFGLQNLIFHVLFSRLCKDNQGQILIYREHDLLC